MRTGTCVLSLVTYFTSKTPVLEIPLHLDMVGWAFKMDISDLNPNWSQSPKDGL